MIKKTAIKLISYIYKKWKNFSFSYGGRIRSKIYTEAFDTCGANLTINGKPSIFKPELINVGNNVTINDKVQLAPRGRIFIGNNVVFSRGSQITAGQLDLKKWSDNQYLKSEHVEEDVYIGDGTWLCINSIILPGVRITGKGCVIAAGAVVTKSFSGDYLLIGGVPARIIRTIE